MVAKENVVAINSHKASSIFENAVALIVDFGKLGRTRKLKGGAYEVEGTEKDRTQASKKLMQCEEFDDITRFDNRTRSLLQQMSVNASMFRDGVWMVKLSNYMKVVTMLKERRDERLDLVDALMSKYDEVQEEDQRALGPNYDPADYPSHDEARSRFRMGWYSIQFSTPTGVKSISQQAFEEETASMKSMVRDLTTDMEKILCGEMQKMLDHMLDALTGGANGRPKKFQNDMVEKASEFFANLPGRNITDKPELNRLAGQIKKLLDGTDSQELKDRGAVRKEVVASFAEFKQQLDSLLVEKPKRAVAFRKGA